LIFSAELLVPAVIAFLLHIFLGFPVLIAYVLLGLWIIPALLVTLGLSVLSLGTQPPPYQKNINPYSKTTKNFTKKFKNDEANSDT